jgi:hypothetical protein
MTPRPSNTSQRVNLAATAAIVGTVVFAMTALFLPLVSEFSLVGDTISELAIGRYGAIQTAAFVIGGLGTLALAYAIRQLTAGVWGSAAGSAIIGSYGAGAMLSAFFPTDRIDSVADALSQSPAGTIHLIIATVSFLCAIAGMCVLVRTFQRDPRWRPLFPWAALLPVAALLLLLSMIEGPWLGLSQRFLVGVIGAWQLMVALRARSLLASREQPQLA